MSRCVIAEYETLQQAKVGLDVLETDQFTTDNVSLVSIASDDASEQLEGLHEDQPDHAETKVSSSPPDNRSVGLGMLIGGSVAAPIAAGTLIGPFIIAGPLAGMAVGAVIGSLLGSAERWGVTKDISADYEQRVKSGSVLVLVHDEDIIRINDAMSLLKTTDTKSLERFELDRKTEA